MGSQPLTNVESLHSVASGLTLMYSSLTIWQKAGERCCRRWQVWDHRRY
jgi:hypothetical protein